MPVPHWVLHRVQAPSCQVAELGFGVPEPTICKPSLGTGTVTWPVAQSGGCSQIISHSGLGQSLGFEQCHSHKGFTHSVLHPTRASPQSSPHFGSSQRVVHWGQSNTLVPLHPLSGQNIAQLGWSQTGLHASRASLPSLGHLVSHLGTGQWGTQFCSHTGLVHFQVQCGTQLNRFSSGTIVGHPPGGVGGRVGWSIPFTAAVSLPARCSTTTAPWGKA
mmetsp:Transcript_55022/g.120666  ORF Transcript_55022/g.120666 Transcript_55022/m.120666 type:complete len:218 (+) Transcript_55022:852-1505(+)